MWWALSAALAGPDPDVVRLVAVVTARDGLRLAPDVLATGLADACAGGAQIACGLQADGGRDVAGVLRSACTGGDALACLGEAWTLLPRSGSSVDEAAPGDPVRFRALVERACDAGVARACTELGTVWLHGLATWTGPGRAAAHWLALCETGEPHACTAAGQLLDAPAAFDRALALGDPTAGLHRAATLPPGDAAPFLASACAAGVTEACFRAVDVLGTEAPEEARRGLEAACVLGDPQACVRQRLLDAAAGTTPVPDAVAALRPYCPAVPSACEEVAFLEDGAPPIARYGGATALGRKDVAWLVDQLRGEVHRCLVAALARDPGVHGEVRAVLRVEPDGAVTGVHVTGAADEPHAACVEATIRASRPRRPEGGTQRLELVFPATHGAAVEVVAIDGVHAAGDSTAVASAAADWAAPFDACVLEHTEADEGIVLKLVADVRRDGAFGAFRVVESTREDGVDDCVIEWLAAHPVGPPGRPHQVLATVRFLEPAEPSPAPAASGPPPAGERPETTARMLVIAVRRGEVDGRRGRLGARSLASIRAAHVDLAAFVAEATRGALTIDWTLEELEGPIEQSLLDDRSGASRYNVAPWDLTPAVHDLVRAGAYDSVVLYAPVPRGFPTPARGVAYARGVAGAGYATIALAHQRVVRANLGYAPFLLPLHEWWHQVEVRAAALGAAVPSNHLPLTDAPVPLDPRDWEEHNRGTVTEWYEEVLGNRVHPELWREVVAHDGPVNVALGVRASRLADGLVGDGGFLLGEPLPAGQTVELDLDGSQPVHRVVAHLAADPATTRPLAIEVAARVGDRWITRTIDLAPGRRGEATAVFEDEPPIGAVRVRAPVDAPAGLVLTELEAWTR